MWKEVRVKRKVKIDVLKTILWVGIFGMFAETGIHWINKD